MNKKSKKSEEKVEQDIQHDFQQVRYTNGLYSGQFRVDKREREGVGLFLWENHDIYVGQWKGDKMQGKGLLV